MKTCMPCLRWEKQNQSNVKLLNYYSKLRHGARLSSARSCGRIQTECKRQKPKNWSLTNNRTSITIEYWHQSIDQRYLSQFVTWKYLVGVVFPLSGRATCRLAWAKCQNYLNCSQKISATCAACEAKANTAGRRVYTSRGPEQNPHSLNQGSVLPTKSTSKVDRGDSWSLKWSNTTEICHNQTRGIGSRHLWQGRGSVLWDISHD